MYVGRSRNLGPFFRADGVQCWSSDTSGTATLPLLPNSGSEVCSYGAAVRSTLFVVSMVPNKGGAGQKAVRRAQLCKDPGLRGSIMLTVTCGSRHKIGVASHYI
jgi:hypothetical protein